MFITLIISLSTAAFAEENIGKILALKGKAVVERDKKKITAKKNQNLFLKDTVSTMKASRLKMRFVDDSILTLGESSRVAIKEYIYSKDKGGKSIFNLLDGKMRSIVGKTKFEIHTPTAVAAARGTIILSEVGRLAGKLFATFICLEGEVEVMSADPSIPGKKILTAGMKITVFEKEPLLEPTKAPPADIDKLKKATEMEHYELSIKRAKPVRGAVKGFDPIRAVGIPPIAQQPGAKTNPVRITLTFQ
ncbi:MAG: FecR domain-containing protein [Nitrospirae bacterium]|nr:FecR domain-containing protein [Nitrospirota bacterium]